MYKYFREFNKKKLPLFDESLMTLEYLHQKMLSFKGMRFCLMFGSNQNRCWKTYRKTLLSESILNNINLLKMVSITVVSV